MVDHCAETHDRPTSFSTCTRRFPLHSEGEISRAHAGWCAELRTSLTHRQERARRDADSDFGLLSTSLQFWQRMDIAQPRILLLCTFVQRSTEYTARCTEYVKYDEMEIPSRCHELRTCLRAVVSQDFEVRGQTRNLRCERPSKSQGPKSITPFVCACAAKNPPIVHFRPPVHRVHRERHRV